MARLTAASVCAVSLFTFVGVNSASLTAQQRPPAEVKVVNAPAEPVPVTGAVVITNGGAEPVPVVATLRSTKQPFSGGTEIRLSPGQAQGSGLITVPDGKQLVIEYVSGYALIETGEVPRVHIAPSLGGFTPPHVVPPADIRTINDSGVIAQYGSMVKLYADPGTQVGVGAARFPTGNEALFYLFISGYLVDCGPGPVCGIE